MRYSKYDIRKSKNSSVVLIFMLILILAIIIGSLIFKVVFKGASMDSKLPKFNINRSKDNGNNRSAVVNGNDVKDNTSNNISNFYAIQCGAFKSKENADNYRKSLADYGNPFIISNGGYYKVLLGIYKENNISEITSKLTEDGIEWTKIIFSFNKDSLCNSEIMEIINANLKVVNKLSEDNVKAIETADFKKWSESLKQVNKKDKNYNRLMKLKDFISELPSKLTKDKIVDVYKVLYNVLNEMNIN
ncbi:cell division protein FtsN [Clostridium tepidiprofundi DSM 19306]|uniref:Cell division protein FtsN n=1 Tax=Clostridium tepidiprofundi DSM 19306 TaxID=1121338 RepID=A0A151B3H9_9CLOT|nr:SPOR domain-containing protein [Clostridium tepidiprofundi]KYH34474.1 cell division protein FtsN [Clostridium tepidiprofundi DSM 19306]